MFDKHSLKSLPALWVYLSMMLVYIGAGAWVNWSFTLRLPWASLLGGLLEVVGRSMGKGAIYMLAMYMHVGHFGLRKKWQNSGSCIFISTSFANPRSAPLGKRAPWPGGRDCWSNEECILNDGCCALKTQWCHSVFSQRERLFFWYFSSFRTVSLIRASQRLHSE